MENKGVQARLNIWMGRGVNNKAIVMAKEINAFEEKPGVLHWENKNGALSGRLHLSKAPTC